MTTVQLAFALPNAPQTRVHVHFTQHAHAIILFLTTAGEGAASTSHLGSFVFAMPSLADQNKIPDSTAIYAKLESLDFATRLAKAVAKRSGKPTYVGSSVSFASAGGGGDVEEEMAGFKRIVEVVMQGVERTKPQDSSDEESESNSDPDESEDEDSTAK